MHRPLVSLVFLASTLLACGGDDGGDASLPDGSLDAGGGDSAPPPDGATDAIADAGADGSVVIERCGNGDAVVESVRVYEDPVETGAGTIARYVSRDGSTITGLRFASEVGGFAWTEAGVTVMPQSAELAGDVLIRPNIDGTVFFGSTRRIDSGWVLHAIRWVPPADPEIVDGTVSYDGDGMGLVDPAGVSDDGAVGVVSDNRVLAWNASTGLRVAADTFKAHDLTADGRFAFGQLFQPADESHPARVALETGDVTMLGSFGVVLAVDGPGRFAVIARTSGTYLWSASGEAIISAVEAQRAGISDDGRVVVFSRGVGADAALIWDPVRGTRSFADELAAISVPWPSDARVELADVSGDGCVVVGNVVGASGDTNGFAASYAPAP